MVQPVATCPREKEEMVQTGCCVKERGMEEGKEEEKEKEAEMGAVMT